MSQVHSGSALDARGVTVTVDGTALVLSPTPLEASLSGSSEPVRIDATSITKLNVSDADAWSGGVCGIVTPERTHELSFFPGDVHAPARLRELVDTAARGEAASARIAGFDFVGFDVETANPAWGSICQIGLVRVIDGREVERVTWLCTPPPGLDEFDPSNVAIHGISAETVEGSPPAAQRIDELVEFVGELPVVAHNAQFDATALREACRAVGRDIPNIMFACTLAQSRAAKLKVQNHRLPTLAEHFGVQLEKHHDAGEDAAACAGILVGLARDAGHEGSVMSFVHATGFTLGVINDERVTPVLRDRSGTARALQAASRDGAAVTPRGSNQHESPAPEQEKQEETPRRGPAPWQSVATPDTIPEPDPQADPNSPLYGHNVTLTGEFEPFDKGQLWSGIAAQGAQVGKNVTKKTTILITGEWATMTSKEKRARELMDKGQDIQIWSAEQLLDALGLNEQPPF
ncbi:exonuclease domain-containing protein [Corynebacterium lipophiloflavum]|uniref:exonuclease domain-containing protein n=1 Tax=Corynebacterium lipophiloflavum TaxID=161889 RepID=UPI00058ACBC6|nr:exonuclease domain-containing protein [Corynebacterium lipophiloflavum]